MNKLTTVEITGLVVVTLLTAITTATWTQIQESTISLVRVESELVSLQDDLKEMRISSKQLAIVQKQIAVVQLQNDQLKERIKAIEER